MEIPRLGKEDLVPVKQLGLGNLSLPADFLSSSFAPDPAANLPWPDGVLGHASWSDEGVILHSGLSPTNLQRGFGPAEDCAQAVVGGFYGLNSQGQGFSGDHSEEDWRVPLAAAEHRGCGSPCGVPSDECLENVGVSASKPAGVHGLLKGC